MMNMLLLHRGGVHRKNTGDIALHCIAHNKLAGGTRNSVWSPAWYHASVVRGHAVTQVVGSTPVELNYI